MNLCRLLKQKQFRIGWQSEGGTASGVKKSNTNSFKERGAGATVFYTRIKTVYLDYSA